MSGESDSDSLPGTHGSTGSSDTSDPDPSGDPALVPRSAFSDSELVFAVVGAVGTESGRVIEFLTNQLKLCRYDVETIKVSRDVIQQYAQTDVADLEEFARISCLMDAGNAMRNKTGNNAILALGLFPGSHPLVVGMRGGVRSPKAAERTSLIHSNIRMRSRRYGKYTRKDFTL